MKTIRWLVIAACVSVLLSGLTGCGISSLQAEGKIDVTAVDPDEKLDEKEET